MSIEKENKGEIFISPLFKTEIERDLALELVLELINNTNIEVEDHTDSIIDISIEQ